MCEFEGIFDFICDLYKPKNGEVIPLHEPKFLGNEKKYLNACIDSGYVSSVGEFVNRLEKEIAKFCGSAYAIATTNGTSALHATLHALHINQECEVITQSLSFIATSNAIAYTGANPIYIDVDLDSLSLSPKALQHFLNHNATKKDNKAFNNQTGKQIKACIPMHTFGHPARIFEIQEICQEWGILLVEDCAESLGSYVFKDTSKIHTGLQGIASILSFNGNKIITSGGGGIILTQDAEFAKLLKHITTTAKLPHPYEYDHNQLGFNYRLPNINAALALAQLEQLPFFLESKKQIAKNYQDFFSHSAFEFIQARNGTDPNFWLNALLLDNSNQRDTFLIQSHKRGIMTRPIWKLNHQTPMFAKCQCDNLSNSIFLQERIVNLPSSVNLV
ncbi:aminotransferase DegT [Helicobacter enhydrae]|uniref:Aminotransferase DegT n=1 Tax=Helicobacter enhydrae TaxID=222136 RepID=A0A1B1U5J9_9HELI|nr:LegC family aminotransferase [Helicobacter enhydrae]ANV98001.1 aminotransferase DegT [Helicobacter enhydrae]